MPASSDVAHLNSYDLAFFAAYLALTVAIGFWAARGMRSRSKQYFLGDKAMPWYVVGASMVSTNISSEHFVANVGAAYNHGAVVATGGWNAWITYSLLIWIFLPYYIRSGIYTPPDRTNVYHLWAATFEGDKHGIRRDDFARELDAVKIKGNFGLGYIQKPAYLHDVIRKPLAYKRGCPTHPPYYEGAGANYEPGLCPVAEDLMPRLIPISTVGAPDQHRRNAEALRNACLKCMQSETY